MNYQQKTTSNNILINNKVHHSNQVCGHVSSATWKLMTSGDV